MTPERIILIIENYERKLRDNGIPKVRMDLHKTLRDLDRLDLLAHAHFLCEGAKEYARDADRQDKANRHFTAIQMCLSAAGWYSLEDLLRHNKPKDETFNPNS